MAARMNFSLRECHEHFPDWPAEVQRDLAANGYSFFHGVARRLGLRSNDADDAVQDVWIEVLGSAATFDPVRGNLWQWLSGVAGNVMRRRFSELSRRNKRHVELQAHHARYNHLDRIVYDELLALVKKRVRQHGGKYAEAVMFELELSDAEIAKAFRRSTNSVQITRCRMRQRIWSWLEPAGKT